MKYYDKAKYNYNLLICLIGHEIHHLIREEFNMPMLVCHICYANTLWVGNILPNFVVTKIIPVRNISNKNQHGHF